MGASDVPRDDWEPTLEGSVVRRVRESALALGFGLLVLNAILFFLNCLVLAADIKAAREKKKQKDSPTRPPSAAAAAAAKPRSDSARLLPRAPHACARGAHAAGSAAVGLAATVRAPASRHLLPWVRHHTQRLGVACVFLFWDAPKDAQMRLLALEPGVFVIGESGLGAARGSAAHPWARMPSYAALSGGDAGPLEQNAYGMQRLNAEVALELAAGAGLEWLLPINAEEAL